MTKPFHHYYFAKVGMGNNLLPLSLRIAKEGNGESFFWVGFRERDIPRSLDVDGKYFKDEKIPSKYRDLYYMTKASHAKNRDNITVITFDSKDVHFWKISGDLRDLNDSERSKVIEFSEKNQEVKKNWSTNDVSDFEELSRGKNPGPKSLPVELQAVFPRGEILPSIEALAVNRYLNSGTFRYLYATNGKVIPQDFMEDNKFLKCENAGFPLLKSEKNWPETKFSCFARKYFDWLLAKTSQTFKEYYYEINDGDIFDLSISIMSPAQIETAAAMFLMSIGMMPEFMVGKSLDATDVRASIRHHPNWKEKAKAEEVLNKLGRLKLSLGDKIKERLKDHGYISVQCKNYDHAKNGDEILLFKPFKNEGDEQGVVSLKDLKKRINEPELASDDNSELQPFKDWLKLSESKLKDDRPKPIRCYKDQ